MDQVMIEFKLIDEDGGSLQCDAVRLIGWDDETYGEYSPAEEGGVFVGEVHSFATAGDLDGNILVTKVSGPKGTYEGWDALRKYLKRCYQ